MSHHGMQPECGPAGKLLQHLLQPCIDHQAMITLQSPDQDMITLQSPDQAMIILQSPDQALICR